MDKIDQEAMSSKPPSDLSHKSSSDKNNYKNNRSTILYDVWVHKDASRLEEQQSTLNSSNTTSLTLSTSNSWWKSLSGRVGNKSQVPMDPSLLAGLEVYQNQLQKAALSSTRRGDLIAHFHSNTLSIRSQKNEFGSVISTFKLPQENSPEMLKMSWNPSGEILALTTSQNSLFIFSRHAQLLCQVNLNQYEGIESFKIIDIAWSPHSAIGSIHNSQLHILSSSGVLWRFLVHHQQNNTSSNNINNRTNNNNTFIVPLAHAFELKDDPKTGVVSNLSSILQYHSAITCMDISQCGKYLIIGGYGVEYSSLSQSDVSQNKSKIENQNNDSKLSNSYSLWRILDIPPFFEHLSPITLDYIPEKSQNESVKSKKRCCGKTVSKPKKNVEQAAKLPNLLKIVQFSPDSSHFLTLDINGLVSIWDLHKQLPVRRFQSDVIWQLTNASLVKNPSSHQERLIKYAYWWDTTSIVVIHECGACSVFGPIIHHCSNSSSKFNSTSSNSAISNILELPVDPRNLLGDSPEKFCSNSLISKPSNERFFIFETEHNLVRVPKKRLLFSTVSGSRQQQAKNEVDPDDQVPFDFEMEGSKKPSCMRRVALKTWRFLVGHSDDSWGEIKVEKVKVSTRLLSLKKTTPQSLFVAKVASGEYEFALNVAKKFKLNEDLVHQTQWRILPVSESSIQDHLNKISNRQWVIRECIERVPKTMQGSIELLNYGIKQAIPSWMDSSFVSLFDASKIQSKSNQSISEALSKIMPSKISHNDSKIIMQRMILLSHLDRLKTFALINENKFFDAAEFLNFRTCSLVNACATFAQIERTKALAALWTYHGPITIPYRLIALFYLPETTLPTFPEIRALLPSMNAQGEVDIWPTQQWRENDWSETELVYNALNLDWQKSCNGKDISVVLRGYAKLIASEDKTLDQKENSIYTRIIENAPCEDIYAIECEESEEIHLDKLLPSAFSEPIYRPLTAIDLSKWYKYRAIDIESLSGQAENATLLVQVGIENGVPKLDKLLAKLKLLCSLVYDCGKDTHLSEFEYMDDARRLHFLLEDATSETILEILSNRCRVYVMNAHKVWASYMKKSTPGFQTAYLAVWMEDVAKATRSNDPSKLGYQQLPLVLKIFQTSSPRYMKKQYHIDDNNLHRINSFGDFLNHEDAHLHSSRSQGALNQPFDDGDDDDDDDDGGDTHKQVEEDEASTVIIPNEFILASLGLHILYLCSPSTTEILSIMNQIYETLPVTPQVIKQENIDLKSPTKPKKLANKESESDAAAMEMSSTTTSETSHMSPTSPSTPTKPSTPPKTINDSQNQEVDQMMIPLYYRLETLGKHLKAVSILQKHGLVRPMETFLTSWKQDDPKTAQIIFEALLQRDIRAQPALTNAQWRETLADMQELRSLLSSDDTEDLLRSEIGIQNSYSSPSVPSSPSVASTSIVVSSSPSSVASSSIVISSSPSVSSHLIADSSHSVPSTPDRTSTFISSPLPSKLSPAVSTPLKSSLVSSLSSSQVLTIKKSIKPLSMDLTYELFCKALLRAGNFNLAKHYLYNLKNYEKLVVSVAQEYFNSCSSAQDQAMEMARECLQLIKLPSQQAIEEQQLIDAVVQMSQLEDKFNLNLNSSLPIQVRNSSNRMNYLVQLVESASSSMTKNQKSNFLIQQQQQPQQAANDIYTRLDELLNIGRLLGCASTVSERQAIKLLAATTAFKCQDYVYSAKLALELADVGSYVPSWNLAHQLSTIESVDLESRLKLLSFAIRYAPHDLLQPMLSLWRSLEFRSTCHEIGIEQSDKNQQLRPHQNSLQFMDTKKLSVMQDRLMQEYTNKLIDLNSSSLIKQQETQEKTQTIKLQLYNFYKPTPRKFPYTHQFNHSKYDQTSKSLAVALKEQILKSNCVDRFLRESMIADLSTSIIRKKDVYMFLALLLDPNVSITTSKKVFEQLLSASNNQVKLSITDLAKSFFSLLIIELYRYLNLQNTHSDIPDPFELKMIDLIQFASNIISKFPALRKSLLSSHQDQLHIRESIKMMEELILTLKSFERKIVEKNAQNSKTIQASDRFGIDSERFGIDQEYTKKTILDAAVDRRPESLEFALNLTNSKNQCELTEYDVLTAHFKSITSFKDIKPNLIIDFVTQYSKILKNNVSNFESLLNEMIELSSGTDLKRLELLYNIKLIVCSWNTDDKDVNEVKYKIKAIKKLIEICNQSLFDWKLFTSSKSDDRYQCIMNFISKDNIFSLDSIMPDLNQVLSSNSFSSSNLFFMLSKKLLSSTPTKPYLKFVDIKNDIDWIAEHAFSRFDSAQLFEFVDQFLLSRSTDYTQRNPLDYDSRNELCDQLKRYLRNLNGDLDEAENEDETFKMLDKIAKHLLFVQSLEELFLSSNNIVSISAKPNKLFTTKNVASYFTWRLDSVFDAQETSSNDQSVQTIFKQMLANGISIHIIEYVLNNTHTNQNLNELIMSVVNDITNSIASITNFDNLQSNSSSQSENDMGIISWLPSPIDLSWSLNAILASIVSGSQNFEIFAQIREKLRNVVYVSSDISDSSKLIILHSIQAYPVLYGRNAELRLKDERKIESLTMKHILIESSENLPSSSSNTSPNPSNDDKKDTMDQHESSEYEISEIGEATTIHEKKLAISKLISVANSKSKFDKIYQLLKLWSEKEDQKASSIKSKTDIKSPIKQSNSIDLDESIGEGWEFEEEYVLKSQEGKQDSQINSMESMEKQQTQKIESKNETSQIDDSCDSSSSDSFSFSESWHKFFSRLYEQPDKELLWKYRQLARTNWISQNHDFNMIQQTKTKLDSWKYAIITSKKEIVDKTIQEMKSELKMLKEGKETRQSLISLLFGGLFNQPSYAKYGVHYDALLLYLILKYDLFIHFATEASLWPQIERMAILLFDSKNIKSINQEEYKEESKEEWKKEILHVKEIYQRDHNPADATITIENMISRLVEMKLFGQAKSLYTHSISSSIESQTQSFELFMINLPRIFEEYIVKCTEKEQNEMKLDGKNQSTNLITSWNQCRHRLEAAIRAIDEI